MKLRAGALVLSPLLNYTCYPFRVLATKYGADLTITEMISAKGLLMHYRRKFNPKTYQMVYTDKEEKNCGIQLFGNEPKIFGEVAQEIENRTSFKFININLGCPSQQVIKNNQGVVLLNNLSLVEEIITEINRNTNLPVTLKTRVGWKQNALPELIKLSENNGIEWIIVHTRYARENYSVQAHREIISEITQESDIPIIANGDIFSYEDIVDYLERGAKGVAIGRWAKGNPLVFSQKKKEDNYFFKKVTEIKRVYREFRKLNDKLTKRIGKKYEGEVKYSKIFALNLIKGQPNVRKMRDLIHKTKVITEIDRIINEL